ncbi:hypothetical protein AOLE_08960 [Acinetobacter oleivorans DR1]|uniref:Uncharacterized protein n=1 Tax=Acinetobacter oleivorans (strain JCM 16667 / KCTC 23045 / DR1) TaxID=436717 RepID=A0AAN0P892_ACISD|nr:hypothetical protein AOLE_08960 [Acinetobacter oleivorans DR1]
MGQLLLLGVLPKHYKLWWQNGSGLTDWVRHPAHPKVSHSRPTATGGNEVCAHKTIPQKGII